MRPAVLAALVLVPVQTPFALRAATVRSIGERVAANGAFANPFWRP